MKKPHLKKNIILSPVCQGAGSVCTTVVDRISKERKSMKNIISALAIMLLVANAAKAQDGSKQYKFGFRASPSVAWLLPKESSLTSEGGVIKIGGGLVADIMFTDNYAIGTGFFIQSYGGKLSYLEEVSESNNVSADENRYIINKNREYNLKYIEIPLTIKLRTNEIGYFTYWAQFGLGLSANIGAKADDVVSYEQLLTRSFDPVDGPSWDWAETEKAGYEDANQNISSDINLFRASLIIGAGIEYNLSGNSSVIAGITFNNGFSDVLKGNGILKDNRDQVKWDFDGDETFFNSAEGSNEPVVKTPATFELSAAANAIELNIGLLF